MKLWQLVTLVVAGAIAAGGAVAQGLPGADASLKGLERVYVEFAPNSLKPDLQEKYTSMVKLELRKAGIRILNDRSELDMTHDGVVAVSFSQLTRALSQDLSLEWVVVQRVTLARTGTAIPAVTWRRYDDKRAVLPEKVAEPMLHSAIDTFLNSWLSANGR